MSQYLLTLSLFSRLLALFCLFHSPHLIVCVIDFRVSGGKNAVVKKKKR